MGEVLFELEQVLRSRQHKITAQEARVFLTCKSKAVKNFTFGSLAAAGVTWAVIAMMQVYIPSNQKAGHIKELNDDGVVESYASSTWRLSKFSRINLSAGAAAFFGLWRFARSLDSCVDDVLALDGSRMQKELANIIVTKYQDDPPKMQLISKHFYSEKVFDDSDQPKLRWRYRNFFSDNVAHGQRTDEGDSPSNSESNSPSNSHGDPHKDSHTDAQNKVHGDSHNDSDSQRTNFESKQILRNSGFDVMADPFDCVFGNLATREEIHLPNTSSTPPRSLTRGHKRSHRRRRMHHQNVSLSSQHA